MTPSYKSEELSIVYGPTDQPLWEKTLATLIREQAQRFGSKPAVIVPWQNATLSYNDLLQRGLLIARSILAAGIKHGDCVGILAGNCYEYLEVVLGAGYIGCPTVVLNNTYTSKELQSALSRTSCKLLFITPNLKNRDLTGHVQSALHATETTNDPSELQIVTFGQPPSVLRSPLVQSYSSFIYSTPLTSEELASIDRESARVQPNDVINLQFTSGTTGAPKAAMLTHRNITNNARHVGARLALSPSSTICSPPPLFHCFGLVMGFLASLAHGATLVLPSETFDARAALAAVVTHACTVLLGVPTMLLAALDCAPSAAVRQRRLVVLAAGSVVPVALARRLEREMGVRRVVVAYGMTETSPVSFMGDARGERGVVAGSLGRVMPHTGAKVVGVGDGRVVRRGERGELWTSGYGVMRGYWGDEGATGGVMKADADGRVWMRTGDECVIDGEGLCYITGRIKDLIIRGGENISPVEIEERLLAHPMISEVSVVGIRDERFGEVVGCFLRSVRPELGTGELGTTQGAAVGVLDW
ncbi:hypothetical protein GTA08_BOTSDO13220 [Botryosphaeria dothidea]|uniref:AMP-dependent synthetase/ligase domain-containing protein n=1 Tax=Botryosphaeria dothidea TaxID=55169 RepID=A0A8H4J0Y4_9PEZI|nr:hypothetical protein GTA08_BOTSDO13220 [Botryosphaeria dothidea]